VKQKKQPKAGAKAPAVSSSAPDVPVAAWSGAAQLAPLLVDIASLTMDPENARKHPDRNLDVIQKSLADFGQTKPVVVREGIIYAGNGMLTAAIRLGWTKIAAVDVSHLTKDKARAYGLADNKSGDLSEWDLQALGTLFRSFGKDEELLAATGFAPFEIDPLMAAEWTPPNTDGSSGEDFVRMVKISLTEAQATVVNGAIERVRETEEAKNMSEGRALELICANFLAQ
jgi:hypothetical protein